MKEGKKQILSRFEADSKPYLKIMHCICRVKHLYLKYILYTHADKIKGTPSFAEWELIKSASVSHFLLFPGEKLRHEKYFVNESY